MFNSLKILYTRKPKKNLESGIGLVEVLLAFGISIIIITALVSLGTFVLRSATSGSNMMQGTRLVNKEIETVRVIRDMYVSDPNLSWEDFYNSVRGCVALDTSNPDNIIPCPSSACFVDLNGSGIGSGSLTSDNITYCIGARNVGSPVDPNKIDIIAVATWTLGGERKYVHNYTRLTNWLY